MESATDGQIDPQLVSLSRRLMFAGDSWSFFSRLFYSTLLRRFASKGDSQPALLPDHAARIGFDLLESFRTGRRVPDLGNPELALLDVEGLLPQHPRFRGYWYDPARHSTVGMILGADVILHAGKHYVVELNFGPSIVPRRRALYDTRYDPIVSGLVAAAKAHGFRRLVPIAFAWHRLYLEEFERAASEFGLTIRPTHCPVARPGTAHLLGLPEPLEPETMYVLHSGLMTPLCRYVDNKWYTSKWLAHAIEHELPATTKLAMPRTRDSFFFPAEEHGEQWPNLVVKLGGGSGSRSVIAGRFRNEEDARATLGVTNGTEVPRPLRRRFLKNLLFYGRERVIYQSFVPPELDEQRRIQLLRPHLFVSPLCTTYLSGHLRVATEGIPERAPAGIISSDDTFVFASAQYRRLSPETEDELRESAADLGRATQAAIAGKFRTS